MKTSLLVTVLCALAHLSCLAAESSVAVLTAADDARIAAMKSPDREKLSSLFADDLHYAHSSGSIDTKDSFLEALLTGKTKYLSYDHEERKFTFPAPGIALMNGRARIQVETAKGQVDLILNYLAVWQEVAGQWQFLAWQSCRLPPPAP